MWRAPLSRERISEIVSSISGAAPEKQREALAGARLSSARGLVIKRDAVVPNDVVEKTRAALGGDIVGRIVPFVISTPERAADGHTLDPVGVDADEYERAPHVFWAHEYSGWRASPSRAAVRIGASTITADKDAVTANCGFYSQEFSRALDGGFSYAVGEIAARQGHRASVGFDVIDAQVANEAVRKTIPWALDISTWRLNEWSLVNFGADANAITEGRHAGIDVEPIARALEQFLDDVGAATGVAREQLAGMWAAAANPSRAKVVVMPAPVAVAEPMSPFDLRTAIADGIRAALTSTSG